MEKTKEFLEKERIYNQINQMEREINSLQNSIRNITRDETRYLNEFALDKDDLKALIEVRKQKIRLLEQHI